MTEIQVTKWIDLGNKQIRILVKDVEENPDQLNAAYFTMELLDNNRIITRFTDCKLVSQSIPSNDEGYVVIPYTYSFSAISVV